MQAGDGEAEVYVTVDPAARTRLSEIIEQGRRAWTELDQSESDQAIGAMVLMRSAIERRVDSEIAGLKRRSRHRHAVPDEHKPFDTFDDSTQPPFDIIPGVKSEDASSDGSVSD